MVALSAELIGVILEMFPSRSIDGVGQMKPFYIGRDEEVVQSGVSII